MQRNMDVVNKMNVGDVDYCIGFNELTLEWGTSFPKVFEDLRDCIMTNSEGFLSNFMFVASAADFLDQFYNLPDGIFSIKNDQNRTFSFIKEYLYDDEFECITINAIGALSSAFMTTIYGQFEVDNFVFLDNRSIFIFKAQDGDQTMYMIAAFVP